MLTKSEKKHVINLIIFAPKVDGTFSVFEKRHDTTMIFQTVEAACEYLKEISKEE